MGSAAPALPKKKVPSSMTTENNQASLFDEFGRCIPAANEAGAHRTTRRWFICQQPEIDYSAIHARIDAQLGGGSALSVDEFKQRADAILENLRQNPATANLVKGVKVPFFLPKASHADIGQALAERYLPAVAQAFETRFPTYTFTDHNKVELTGQLSVGEKSRHDRLIHAMSQDCVVGYYFPALLEFSIPAARRQIDALPDNFVLAGGYDTCAAFIGSPDLLLRTDGYPPLLWMAGLDGEKENIGYHLEAYGYNLTFNRRAHLGQTAEYWGSGLAVLG